jgi:hypothetical protein
MVHGESEVYLFNLDDDKFCRQLHMADILKDLQGLWAATGRPCLNVSKFSLINGVISKTRKTANIVVMTYANV